MLYPICPTCGKLLGNKQKAYDTEIRDLYHKHKINEDSYSRLNLTNKDAFDKERSELVIRLCKGQPCCQMRLMNYIDKVKLMIGTM